MMTTHRPSTSLKHVRFDFKFHIFSMASAIPTIPAMHSINIGIHFVAALRSNQHLSLCICFCKSLLLWLEINDPCNLFQFAQKKWIKTQRATMRCWTASADATEGNSKKKKYASWLRNKYVILTQYIGIVIAIIAHHHHDHCTSSILLLLDRLFHQPIFRSKMIHGSLIKICLEFRIRMVFSGAPAVWTILKMQIKQ